MKNVKLAKVITASKDKVSKVPLFLQDNETRDYSTIQDLLDEIEYWKQFEIDKKGNADDLLNSPITINLQDIEGQIVDGDIQLIVGEVEIGKFILSGNIKSISFVKE